MVFGIFETLTFACLVLLLGFYIVKKVKFFRDYNIPEPVVGGFLTATLLYLIYYFFGLSFQFESSLQTAMMLIFFSSIGLSADFAKLKQGGKPLLLFIGVTGIFIFFQNLFGISIAKLIGLDPSYGLIAGSITLTGGHGTGAAWAENLTKTFHIEGAMELAMACATYGLVMGGIIGGPVANFLLKKKNIQPVTQSNGNDVLLETFENVV